MKTITVNGTEFIDNRPPFYTDEDDEFKTTKALGFPVHMQCDNQKLGYPPMLWQYMNTDITSYPFKRTWIGANMGNDEVLAHRKIGYI